MARYTFQTEFKMQTNGILKLKIQLFNIENGEPKKKMRKKICEQSNEKKMKKKNQKLLLMQPK